MGPAELLTETFYLRERLRERVELLKAAGVGTLVDVHFVPLMNKVQKLKT